MNHNSSLRLVTVGNDTRVLDGAAELLRITVGDLYMGEAILVRLIRFRPDGPLRINNPINFWHNFVPPRRPGQPGAGNVCARSPMEGNVVGASLGCHFHGSGIAWDEIVFKKLSD